MESASGSSQPVANHLGRRRRSNNITIPEVNNETCHQNRRNHIARMNGTTEQNSLGTA
jgi:hypothetical protein